jgi:hypothetical protein
MTPAAPFLVGVGLALAVGALATRVGFDRERSFYPTVLMVVGSYYVLFAAEGSAPSILACEAVGMALFVVAAVVGFRSSLWIVVAGLLAHGIFDAVHGHILANAGTPAWWPAFCGTYDVTAAAYLGLRLSKGSLETR